MLAAGGCNRWQRSQFTLRHRVRDLFFWGTCLLAGANQEVLQLECQTAQTVVLFLQEVRLVGHKARHLRKVRVDELARLEYVRIPRRDFWHEPADLPGLARRMPHLRPPSGFSGMSSCEHRVQGASARTCTLLQRQPRKSCRRSTLARRSWLFRPSLALCT